MRKGRALLLGAGLVLTSACAAKNSQVAIRAIADPAAKLEHGSDRTAEARGQLALGNIGLAVEGFHAALREQPDSVEAMGGLADCYDRIGRSDLSRQYFEQALSIAPHNPAVLSAFAASLAAQGKVAEAAEVRNEAEQAWHPSRGQPTYVAAQSVTVELPPPPPLPTLSRPPAPQPPAAVAKTAAADAQRREGAHLQRLSLGEVALITSASRATAGRPRVLAASAVQWVPLNDGTSGPSVRLLNAARWQGLAARTREYLMQRGWRRIEIGDADAVRATTSVIYPEGRQATGRRLAAQFGVRSQPSGGGKVIIVYLGRDGAATKATQGRG